MLPARKLLVLFISPVTSHQSPVTSPQSPVPSHQSLFMWCV
ncbi:MAG: hypothetical protein ACKPB4_19365 [Sphaerospermopsis kisseleviana]